MKKTWLKLLITFLFLGATSCYAANRVVLVNGSGIEIGTASNPVETSGGGGSGHTIQEEGSGLTARTNLNFIGSSVTCVDNSGNDATDCTVTGSGSGVGDSSTTEFTFNNSGTLDGASTFKFTNATLTVTNSGTLKSTTGYIVGSGVDQNEDAIIIDRASSDAIISWDETNDEFDITHTINVSGTLEANGINITHGGNTGTIDPLYFKSFALETPVDQDNFILAKFPYAVTIVDIDGIVDPADSSDSIPINIRECNSTADSCLTVSGTITIDNDGTTDSSHTNASIDSGDYIDLFVGSPTGTVDSLSGTITYTID